MITKYNLTLHKKLTGLEDLYKLVDDINNKIADLQTDLRKLTRQIEEEEHDLKKLVGVRGRGTTKDSISNNPTASS